MFFLVNDCHLNVSPVTILILILCLASTLDSETYLGKHKTIMIKNANLFDVFNSHMINTVVTMLLPQLGPGSDITSSDKPEI